MNAEPSLLRLFIDSANPEDWETYLRTGIFYGVTTNPKLLAMSEFPFKAESMKDMARTAFDLGANQIHIQVWGETPEEIVEVGRELAAIDNRVMIKVPIDSTGILVANQLINEGANVTLTAVHSTQQVMIAIGMGARYAAPYLGRMNDAAIDGISEVKTMGEIIKRTGSPLRLLVASIRSSKELVLLASRGLNTFTLTPRIVQEMIENDLTRLAVESFNQAVSQSADS
jgi:transaldolase